MVGSLGLKIRASTDYPNDPGLTPIISMFPVTDSIAWRVKNTRQLWPIGSRPAILPPSL